MKHSCILLSLFVVLPLSALAQGEGQSAGLKIGPLRLSPSLDIEAGYDDRVVFDADGQGASGDLYSEWAAAGRLNNEAARVGFAADGRYGERYYNDNAELNDDFYDARASFGMGQGPTQAGLSAAVTKSISYDLAVDPAAAEGPGGILTDGESRSFVANANLSYEYAATERTAIVPYVGATHFFQDFEDQSDAEWQTYSVGCELAFAYSERSLLILSGDHAVQVNDDEDGTVSSAAIGTRSRATESISWSAEVGVAIADYDNSGSEEGFTGQLRVLWQLTDKVATYAFGNQDYQPGYGDFGARTVYRAGYGADWQLSSRWSVSGQGLHNHEEEVGGTGTSTLYDGVENFYTLSTTHTLGERAAVSAGISYADDEFDVDQIVYSISLQASL